MPLLSDVLRAPARGAKKSTESTAERNPGSSADAKKQPMHLETEDSGPGARGSRYTAARGIKPSFSNWQSTADTA